MIALRNVYSAEYRFPDVLMTENRILGDFCVSSLIRFQFRDIRTSRLARWKPTKNQRLKIFWFVPLSPPLSPIHPVKLRPICTLIWMRHQEEGSDTLSGVLCHGSDYDKVAPNIHMYTVNWGRILGRNWGKSLRSFPPCYSQSPLLTDFTPPPPPPSKNGLKLVCNVNIV
jgi:hypothetical protein